jgi:hypothetical protein
MDPESLRGVLCPKRPDRIGGHRRRRGHIRNGPPVRPAELERAVGQPLELVALLVHRVVMPATQ